MILFFIRGEVGSDSFIRYCYNNYRNVMLDVEELPENVEILREEGKKPRFDIDGVHFNLSHSYGVTVCAMSYTEVGVDIEKIRPVRFEKFPFIEARDEKEFFEKWTERESYVKFTGEGIAKIKSDVPSDAHFEHFDVFDGYHVAVCAEEQNLIAYELDIDGIKDF